MPILDFLLGLFIASFFIGAVGAVAWNSEKTRRMRAESEYELLAAKLEGIEEMHNQVSQRLEESDSLAKMKHEQVQRLVGQLQQAGATIHKLQQQLHGHGHGSAGSSHSACGMIIYGHGPGGAQKPEPPGREEDDDGESPAITGLN
jgi:hypothetical protein